MRMLRTGLLIALVLALASSVGVAAAPPDTGGGAPPVQFRVRVAPEAVPDARDGRVYVIVTRSGDSEPRYQVDIAGGVPFWGRDVSDLRPGKVVTVGGRGTYGYPFASTARLPGGEYFVQAFFNTYTTFRRSDGSTVKLHLPCGDGQSLFDSPGNLYSSVRRVRVTPGQPVDLRLDQVVRPADPVPPGGTCQQGNPPDSAHVKHVKIRSRLLSRYWGHPMYIAANVLLPRGYANPSNRERRYPLEVHHGHFPFDNPHGFVEDGSNDFSRFWLSPDAPRFVSVELRHENPYYDDSYAVNSANLGPYGDAINHELLPAIERRFRTIGQRYGRVLTGGSTGGWEALASQVFYPDMYGGAWASCPDSTDFRFHQLVDVYDDDNAYYTDYEWERVDRPSARETSGDIIWTMAQENHWELALGNRTRSGGQWDIWEAVFSPQGPDGYPARAWNKRTGDIHHSVTRHWARYDLRRRIVGDWPRLGHRLRGRLHVFTGTDDTFFLENSTELLQQALARLRAPRAGAEFVYGPGEPHCWSPYTPAELLQVMAEAIADDAPPGADLSWRGAAGAARASTAGVVRGSARRG